MANVAAAPRRARAEFLADLISAGLLIPSGVDGAYGRGGTFEAVRAAVDAFVTRRSLNVRPERMAFPPVLPRRQLERIGYLSSFPHLAGTIFSFEGDEAEAAELERRVGAGEDWGGLQRQTDLVLVPAACYPVYPAVAARGPLPVGGLTVDLGGSYVFRNEPSCDPARWQMFHQREMIRLGAPDEVAGWRDAWAQRAVEIVGELGLEAAVDVATDPFFGRSGRLLARSQRSQSLKLELAVWISGDEPTAVASFNYHREHFSSVFDLREAGGEQAHTACVGFGLERVALALFSRHGLDPARWPADVTALLLP
ncbi:MAG TPA: amino acid--[acyl-carrier-protein] ligase [Gaiellaceae bacterium]|nr:amino acid--[acyl-carrier-protein] ligase [Gaiellaceae bacterium]